MSQGEVTATAGGPLLAAVAAGRRAYGAALDEVVAAVWDQDAVDAPTLDLCRIRIGQLLGAAPRPSHADPDLAVSLARWPTDERFDTRLRTALGYAEQLLVDAQEVTDEMAAAVVGAFGEPGFLVLTYACGVFETTQRAELILGREGSTT